jgi:hypothetical protein
MEKRVHFNKAAGSVAGSEKSYPNDTRSTSKGKRKVDDTRNNKGSRKKADASSKRRKVSVYDAVAGKTHHVLLRYQD